MATTAKKTRKFRIHLAAQRYANSEPHIRTITGNIESPTTATTADLMRAVQNLVHTETSDLHAIGRIDITLYA